MILHLFAILQKRFSSCLALTACLAVRLADDFGDAAAGGLLLPRRVHFLIVPTSDIWAAASHVLIWQ